MKDTNTNARALIKSSEYVERYWIGTLREKKNCIRRNQSPLSHHKTLSKEITKRTKLRNNFLKTRSKENRKKYTKHRNFCVSLLRKAKQNYCHNLHKKSITDNRKFLKK